MTKETQEQLLTVIRNSNPNNQSRQLERLFDEDLDNVLKEALEAGLIKEDRSRSHFEYDPSQIRLIATRQVNRTQVSPKLIRFFKEIV